MAGVNYEALAAKHITRPKDTVRYPKFLIYGRQKKGKSTFSLSGGTLLEAGSVTNAQLTLQGASSARITEVNGGITIVASGSSDVRVRQGSASTLVINTSGASEARFDGVAEMATLVSSGASSIRVERVKQQPVKNKTGASSISVRNIG